MMTMKTKIVDFKARLSYYLRAVRMGKEVTVMERETPIARVIPYHKRPLNQLSIHPASRSPKTLASLQIQPMAEGDSATVLAEMREDDLEEL